MNFLKRMSLQGKITPELISVHIPKTAGTSFAEILKEVYGHTNIGSLHIQSVGKSNDLIITYQDKPVKETELNLNTMVLHGHFPYRRIPQIIKPSADTPIITWLRHPVERVISAYHYADNIYRKELSETNPRLNILNTLKRNLMEYAFIKGSRNVCTQFLEGAKLEDLYFVGIVEHFEEDLAYLSQLMGWKNYQVPHLNRTSKRPPLAAGVRQPPEG